MNYLKPSLFIVAILAFSLNLFGQSAELRLDSLFKSQNQHHQLNGNVLVAENGKVIYKNSFGLQDMALHIQNNDNSCFKLASITKTFTATAILQLKEKKKLRLDDAFGKYFPGFPYKTITIRHLLSHTSGLPDEDDLFDDSVINKYPTKIWSNADIIPALKKYNKPLAFKPGDKWDYSNTNFNLLALLIEKLSGLKFEDYMKRYIFSPAQMNDTYYQNALLNLPGKNQSINYSYPVHYAIIMKPVKDLPVVKKYEYNLNGFLGSGELVSTVADMLKYDQALYTGKLLKPAILEEAFKPTILNDRTTALANSSAGDASYGLGWFIMKDTTAGKVVWHTGAIPGGLTIFLRNISRKQMVIVLDNTESDALFTTGTNALNILNNKKLTIRKHSIAEYYSKALFEKGADYAAARLVSMRADSAYNYLSPGEMDFIGREFLKDNYTAQALEMFKVTTLLFPTRWQFFKSYGDALAKNGENETAILAYEKALEIDPKNDGIKKALEQLKGAK